MKMRRCSHCKEEKEATTENFARSKDAVDRCMHRCLICDHERRLTSEYRASNAARQTRERAPGGTQWAAHLANRAVSRGEIVRQPCFICGSLDTEMHHEDYSKPLEVMHLCHFHHDEADMRRRARERGDREVTAQAAFLAHFMITGSFQLQLPA